VKILVTGSNGFIGKHICKRLRQEHEIIGLGTKSEGTLSGIQYIQADIVSLEFIPELKDRLNSCDVIIHVAACIDMSLFNDKLIDVNCKGTSHIMQLAKEIGCHQLIHTSSLPVIGFPTELPIIEEQLPKPNTLYHSSKLAAEYIVNQGVKYGIKPVNLRLPSPIGVGMSEKTLLPILLKQSLLHQPISIYGKGLRRQNYIDVRDITDAVEKCIANGVEGTYNIASETVISNIDLAKLCIEMTNSDSRITFTDKEDLEEKYCWDISIEKAKEAFAFKPQYTLRNTIMDILYSWKQIETV
jgi:UDP-glucose 4-epimerase